MQRDIEQNISLNALTAVLAAARGQLKNIRSSPAECRESVKAEIEGYLEGAIELVEEFKKDLEKGQIEIRKV